MNVNILLVVGLLWLVVAGFAWAVVRGSELLNRNDEDDEEW